jgi:hypothetical protein
LQAYLIEVGENTNIKLTDELSAFMFSCNSNFVIREELSYYINTRRTVAGEDIFCETVNLIKPIRTSTQQTCVHCGFRSHHSMTGIKNELMKKMN